MHRNHPDLIQTDWETLGSKKEKLQARKSPGIQNVELYFSNMVMNWMNFVITRFMVKSPQWQPPPLIALKMPSEFHFKISPLPMLDLTVLPFGETSIYNFSVQYHPKPYIKATRIKEMTTN